MTNINDEDCQNWSGKIRKRMKLIRIGRTNFGIKEGVIEKYVKCKTNSNYRWVVIGYTGRKIRHPYKMRPLIFKDHHPT